MGEIGRQAEGVDTTMFTGISDTVARFVVKAVIVAGCVGLGAAAYGIYELVR